MDAGPMNCKKPSRDHRASFVADGRERALVALDQRQLDELQRTIEAEFADRIAGAGPLRRLWLRWKMYQAVRRATAAAVEEQAPRGGLYAWR